MSNTGLIEKIRDLPPHVVSEVENFIDFLATKEHLDELSSLRFDSLEDLNNLSREDISEQRAALLSFADDWERADMEVYDKL